MPLTAEELAMLTDEEREGLLEGEEDNDGEQDETDADDQDDDKQDDNDGDNADNADDDADKQDQGDDKQDDEDGDDDEITPQPAPLFKADVPADIQAKRQEIDSKEDALVEQFDNGDITFAEYNKQLRQLNNERSVLERAELKAELAREASVSQFEQNWNTSLNTFLADHPEIDLSNDVHTTIFDKLLRQETAPVIEKGGQIGIREIKKAHARFLKELNLTGAEPKAEPAPKAKAKKDNVVPPTLGKVPASTATSTDDGRFAHLDRLADSDPIKFEEALLKMSAADRDAYMAS